MNQVDVDDCFVVVDTKAIVWGNRICFPVDKFCFHCIYYDQGTIFTDNGLRNSPLYEVDSNKFGEEQHIAHTSLPACISPM